MSPLRLFWCSAHQCISSWHSVDWNVTFHQDEILIALIIRQRRSRHSYISSLPALLKDDSHNLLDGTVILQQPQRRELQAVIWAPSAPELEKWGFWGLNPSSPPDVSTLFSKMLIQSEKNEKWNSKAVENRSAAPVYLPTARYVWVGGVCHPPTRSLPVLIIIVSYAVILWGLFFISSCPHCTWNSPDPILFFCCFFFSQRPMPPTLTKGFFFILLFFVHRPQQT